ncbi:Mu-like prophage I protein [compost metagenome]
MRWSLNLPATSTPQEIQVELQKVIDMIKAQSGGEAALTSKGLAVYLKGQFEQVAALSAQVIQKTAALTAASGQVDLTQFVPRATYDGLVQQVAALSAKTDTQSVDTLIKTARDNGQLLACEEDYARALASQQGVVALSAMIDARPSIAALTASAPQSQVTTAPVGVAVLTDTQLVAAKSLGLSPAEYLAQYPV